MFLSVYRWSNYEWKCVAKKRGVPQEPTSQIIPDVLSKSIAIQSSVGTQRPEEQKKREQSGKSVLFWETRVGDMLV